MNKTELDISNLKNAIETLRTCHKDYKTVTDEKIKEYIKDASVKRFEYTIETSWKIMKRYLKLEYGKTDKELTMNNIFRYMEGYGFIQNWQNWKMYYSKRNDTSHEYNNLKSYKIIEILDDFITDCDYLYNQLSKVIEE